MGHLLNFILWTPVVGMLLVLLSKKENESLTRIISLCTTGLTLVACVVLYLNFDPLIAGIQPHLTIKVPWISSFHINYYLGIDGISLPMILLNGLLFFLCTLSSWTIGKSVKAYFSLILMLETTVFGVFMALDFFLFYVFWEVMLLPMFFLIGIWGGENREYAAIKFFLYTFFGSIFMLIAMVALYFVSGQGPDSFDIIALQGGKFLEKTIPLFGHQLDFNTIFFWALFIAFAIKVPVFPFHTWLPHAHVQAPTAVSVILAGVLLKMGTYGFLRISFPIFPKAASDFSCILAILGLINVIYGALCAMAQKDIKKLVAYSSVSHMGFVMLGLASLNVQGMNGAVLQMFNHGTSTAMMFLLVGILYERSHHRWIIKPDGSRGYSGIAVHLPIYTTVFIIGMFASLGLPGLSGFISEALIFLGAFPKFKTITAIASVGLLLGAAYLLYMYKRMFFGEPNEDVLHCHDMNGREIFYMLPLCLAVIVFGIFPTPVLNIMKNSVGQLVDLIAQY